MLEKYRELLKRDAAKKAARKEVLAALDAEFGDTAQAIEDERQAILQWMKENKFKTHYERYGSVELRTSAPKYVVVNELELKVKLALEGYYDALEIKKAPVNSLKKAGQLSDELVEIQTEEEIAISVTDGSGDGVKS